MAYEKKEVLVEIKDVCLNFGSKVILKNVNATIHNITRPDCIQGQVVCFLGPSGIGKTQLSRIIAGLQPATSGGQRQRIAIIRQLLVGNQFIIMDEPFSGLDLKMKANACELITQVANLDTHNTIIIVTHDVTEGMSIADTIWLMGRDAGIPGARIIAEYDLAAAGLCWRPDLLHDPTFQSKVLEVKEKFLEISKN